MENKKKIAILFLIFGILTSLGGAYNIYDINTMKENAVEINAVVTDIHRNRKISMNERESRKQTDYTLTLSYTVDGEEYEMSYNSHTAKEIGDLVTIYYDKTNPGHATITIDISTSVVMLVIGIVIIVIGIVIYKKKEKVVTPK